MLESFREYWDKLEGDKNGRHGLVMPIVERVYMDAEVKMTLNPNHHLVSGHNANRDTEYTVAPSY